MIHVPGLNLFRRPRYRDDIAGEMEATIPPQATTRVVGSEGAPAFAFRGLRREKKEPAESLAASRS